MLFSLPTDIDRELIQIQLVNYFQSIASCFYDDNHQPYTVSVGDSAFHSVSGSLGPHVKSDIAAQASEHLLAKNISQVAAYKKASSAILLIGRTDGGKVCAIRIPYRMTETGCHQRTNHPGILQPFPDGIVSYGEDQNIETLPFIAMANNPTSRDPSQEGVKWAGDSRSRETAMSILYDIHQAAGLMLPNGIRNDLGVLPTGVLALADPDQGKFLRSPLSLKEISERQRSILAELPLLEPILWIGRDGRPKQEHFFGADYLATPLPPEDRPVFKVVEYAPH